ncbi:MAG: hypothetical protein SFU55_04460 [Methylophilus sp.]|nr:hypothetical protein [Methylophilus sp.]
MLNPIFQKRFSELEIQLEKLPFTPNNGMLGTHVPSGVWQQWATSAQNLILTVFRENSPHYSNFLTAFKNCGGYDYDINVLKGVFLSAKEDFEGGYVFNVDLQISGEIFGDFIGMAKHALSENHVEVAAVLACAALEDTLKRFATNNGLSVSEKSMQEVVSALKSKGLVSGAQKTLLDSMPKIRDFAMHANWEKLSAPDVSSVIGFVEQFLLSKFS